MQKHISPLQELKESPQWILLPSKDNTLPFIAAIVAILFLCIVSFSFVSLLP